MNIDKRNPKSAVHYSKKSATKGTKNQHCRPYTSFQKLALLSVFALLVLLPCAPSQSILNDDDNGKIPDAPDIADTSNLKERIEDKDEHLIDASNNAQDDINVNNDSNDNDSKPLDRRKQGGNFENEDEIDNDGKDPKIKDLIKESVKDSLKYLSDLDDLDEQESSSSSSSSEKGNRKSDDNELSDFENRPRITLLGLEELGNSLGQSGIIGLGSHNTFTNEATNTVDAANEIDADASHGVSKDADGGNESDGRWNYPQLHANDLIEDSFYDPLTPDPSCGGGIDGEDAGLDSKDGGDCWHPPDSTIEEEFVMVFNDDEDVEAANNEDNDSQSVLDNLATGYGGVDSDGSTDDEKEKDKQKDSQQKEQVRQQEDECTDTDTCPSHEIATATASTSSKKVLVDKHWGSDIRILQMRDRLRGRRSKYWDWIENQQRLEKEKRQQNKKQLHQDEQQQPMGKQDSFETSQQQRQQAQHAQEQSERQSGKNEEAKEKQKQQRPPVFLLPGLASTRLVSWKHTPCHHSPLLSDVKMLDYVWLNMNMLIQMATIDVRCFSECLTLGPGQSDMEDDEEEEYDEFNLDEEFGQELNATKKAKPEKTEKRAACKLRPDEGLDAISSLAPNSVSTLSLSNLLVGGTNTVYAWLIQWLADNLGYDVSSIVALPYDWRLSPDVMERRDGFLTNMRGRIESAVKANGLPGIIVAHSMGNSVFRYFQEWLRVQMREEAYKKYVEKAEKRAASQGHTFHETAPLNSQQFAQPPSSEEISSEFATAPDTTDTAGSMFWRGRAFVDDWVRYYLPGSDDGGEGEIADGSEDTDGNDSFEDDMLDELKDVLDLDDEENVPSNTPGNDADSDGDVGNETKRKYPKLWELAKIEGDSEWIEWLGKHIWTYVGLAAPLLGAPGPLRAVLSGENMGLPFTDEEARTLELSFGSTSTVNTISTKMGFCDGDNSKRNPNRSNLACLDELVSGIEASKEGSDFQYKKSHDPWKNYPALRKLLKDRVDFDSCFPMVKVETEHCEENEKSPCNNSTNENFGPNEVMNGRVFDRFSKIWNEKNNPMGEKLEQLRQSWWNGLIPNPLVTTPDRPHIKHVIMAYGIDVPTEAGFVYQKSHYSKKNDSLVNSTDEGEKRGDLYDGVPPLTRVIWEEKYGNLFEESKIVEPVSFTESILRKKKPKRQPLNTSNESIRLHHSGDGTIPYISLMWSHTWLLHATRAMRSINSPSPFSEGERISDDNALDSIRVSHRPKGGNEWIEGYGVDPRSEENMDYESRANIGDTGTSHPHGTKYKPKMVRFQSSGKSRSTGMQYTTTVIEAIGVEHKETTRNYDILAAAFTDVLKNLHDDFDLV